MSDDNDLTQPRSFDDAGLIAARPLDVIREWVGAALSEHNRRFRVTALSKAFGLHEPWLWERYGNGGMGVSLGPYLEQQMAEWTEDHPTLSANDPEFETTFFANLRID